MYKTYTEAVNLTKSQLIKTNKGYSYNGLDLLSEDCDWIDSSLNEKGGVNQGAVYRKIAMLLLGYEMRIANYQKFSQTLIGFIPESSDDFAPYAKNAMQFITLDNDIVNIMKKFESLECVQGDFDYNSGDFGKFSFKIYDLKECAEKMQISEEMLGYIFALLDEYAPEIKFKDNSCSFVYGKDNKYNKIEKISAEDFIAEYEGEEHDILNILKQNESGYFQYFAFDASVDLSKKDVIKTNRGIFIGSTKKDVYKKYGKAGW